MDVTTAGRRAFAGAIVLAAALAACGGDARIGKLSAGISRDSVLKILAQGGGTADSLPHVYREDTYLSGGKQIDVVFYTSGTEKAPPFNPAGGPAPEGPVPEASLTPIVLVDGKVVGWGWTSYDSAAKAVGFLVRPR